MNKVRTSYERENIDLCFCPLLCPFVLCRLSVVYLCTRSPSRIMGPHFCWRARNNAGFNGTSYRLALSLFSRCAFFNFFFPHENWNERESVSELPLNVLVHPQIPRIKIGPALAHLRRSGRLGMSTHPGCVFTSGANFAFSPAFYVSFCFREYILM